MKRSTLEEMAENPFDEKVAVISITDIGTPIVQLKNMPQEILRLSFDDLENDVVVDQLGQNPTLEHRKKVEEKYHMFSDEQADQIARFYKTIAGNVNTLICQCEHGQSRSAAIVAAILEFRNKSGIRVFAHENYYPNKLVFSKVLNRLKLNLMPNTQTINTKIL